jgi:hypothetical protein
MITADNGRADWTGAVSGGIGGTRSTGALVAAAKPAALTADKAPVTATTPEKPPIVHDPTRLKALSRSSGRYGTTSVVSAAATTTAAVITPRCRGSGGGRPGCRRRAGAPRVTGPGPRSWRGVGDHDDFMDGRRLCRSRIEAVGPKRRTWELCGHRALSSGAERRERADVACGTEASDDAGQPNEYDRREEVRASMTAQDVLQVASATTAPDPCH